MACSLYAARMCADLTDDFQNGVASINLDLPLLLPEDLTQRALWNLEHASTNEGYATQGGRSFFYIYDGHACREFFPELYPLYDQVLDIARGIVGEPIIASPYERSAVNLKVYHGRNNGQGWHYDSNPISALLYLTSGGTMTRFVLKGGKVIGVTPEVGKLILFRGRDLLHSVPLGDSTRITVPFNIYLPGDVDRPDWIDGVNYDGQTPPVSQS